MPLSSNTLNLTIALAHKLAPVLSTYCFAFLVIGLMTSCSPDSVTLKKSSAENMVFIPGDTFTMGLEHPMMPEAGPTHQVSVDDFYIGKYEVTNAEFERFVKDTQYLTIAERPLNSTDFPNADPSLLVPGSVVFTSPGHPVSKRDPNQWWQYVPGANWRKPEGPNSSIKSRLNHPVIHVAWEDALAYANWADQRLPTEAEWELAARGGLAGAEYVWGEEPPQPKNRLANIFQGEFPHANSRDDGYITSAPVGSFKPNNFGLYDMSGNAWEWVQNWYDPTEYNHLAQKKEVTPNPRGPEQPANGLKYKVQKGGSFLCTDQYCGRFRPGARGRGDWQTSSNHVGFRLAMDAKPK